MGPSKKFLNEYFELSQRGQKGIERVCIFRAARKKHFRQLKGCNKHGVACRKNYFQGKNPKKNNEKEEIFFALSFSKYF